MCCNARIACPLLAVHHRGVDRFFRWVFGSCLGGAGDSAAVLAVESGHVGTVTSPGDDGGDGRGQYSQIVD